MKEYVNMVIDGANIRAVKGATVLDTALEYGTCIPHLCHVPYLQPLGACRLCIVEVVKNGWSKVTASCSLDVQEGMVVRTNSDKILRLRRNIAELLVAQAPDSRAIQDIAVRCGVQDVRYPFRNDHCVLCGRCVRVCEEVWQALAIGFIGRGKERRVGYPFERKPDFCKDCNTCIDMCPMTITPCPGPMETGKEFLCGLCESQLSMAQDAPDMCIQCRLGEGFQCTRSA